jgi:hypothetical protein
VIGAGVSEELGVPKLDELEVGEVFTDVAKSLVIEAVAVEVDALEMGSTREFGEEVAGETGTPGREKL